MTENRYYKKDWEESYYIFDPNTISEDEFEERVEYEGYDVFADSLTGNEIIDLLNENDKLKKEYQKLKHRHSLLHDECLDIECERDNLKKDVNSLEEENKQLKQRINSRLHFYRGLYESTNDKVVERVIEDLEDILKR